MNITNIAIYTGLALLAVGVMLHVRWRGVFGLLTLACGYLTYVAADMGGVDKVTLTFGFATLMFAAVTYALVKNKGGAKAKAAAPASVGH